jgi:LysM repeat protein
MIRKTDFVTLHRWGAVGVLLSLLLFPTLVSPAYAVDGTVVRLEPSSAAVEVGETTSVQIVVENVTNLFAVEAHLVFDPTILEVVDADSGMAGIQIALGPFATVDYVAQNTVDLGTGHIDFGYSQMPPSTGRTGTGTVATITFRGKAAGTSPLTFSGVILADPGANQISATTQNGQVVATEGAVPTNTPTGTVTATSTPTPTGTPPAGALLRFSPQQVTVGVGQAAVMTLRVENVEDLYGVEAHVTHGSGINGTNITAGSCVADVIALQTVAGNEVKYAASLQAPSSPFNGSCDLATVTVEGLSPGTHYLQFVVGLLSDPDGNPIPVTVQHGSVVVSGGAVTPAPTPPPPVHCGDVLGYHVVRSGETVYAIARAYGVRPDAIASCNALINPNLIYPGNQLAIPDAPWFPIPPGAVAVRQFGDGPSISCRYLHTVQWGENLTRISLQYGVSMWAIAEANSIYNLHYIQAGQVLCIP